MYNVYIANITTMLIRTYPIVKRKLSEIIQIYFQFCIELLLLNENRCKQFYLNSPQVFSGVGVTRSSSLPVFSGVGVTRSSLLPVFSGVGVTRSSSLPVFSGVRVTRSLVLCVCFADRCLFFCPFTFGHCVVCSSSILRILITSLLSSNSSFKMIQQRILYIE